MVSRFPSARRGPAILSLALVLSCVIATASATDTDGIDFSELYEQAEFAAAAYRPEAEIRALAEERGYTLTLHHTLEATQVAFFLATGEAAKTQLISIRGTSNVVNAMLDISVKLKPDADTGLRLHEGFAAAAKQVFEEVKPLLLQGYRIRLTGHSLGGAVASILALYLDKAGFDLARVVTFGQPKFTNIAGAAEFRRIDLIRVVTPADLVPLLPPFDPLDIKDLDVYWHAGTEVVLLADTEYAVLDGIDSMLRATRFTRQTLSEENLAYHRMALYLEMIAPKTGGAVRVPYPTDFNIFNIFGG